MRRVPNGLAKSRSWRLTRYSYSETPVPLKAPMGWEEQVCAQHWRSVMNHNGGRQAEVQRKMSDLTALERPMGKQPGVRWVCCVSNRDAARWASERPPISEPRSQPAPSTHLRIDLKKIDPSPGKASNTTSHHKAVSEVVRETHALHLLLVFLIEKSAVLLREVLPPVTNSSLSDVASVYARAGLH